MRKTLLTAALALLLPIAAQAHMPWLLPNATLSTGRENIVSIDAVLSEDLFTYERALKLERVTVTAPDGSRIEAQNRSAARNHESFDITLAKQGTYRISNFGRSAMGAYKLGGETKRFRGSVADVPADADIVSLVVMSSRQETFVSREESSDAKFAPEGDGLELLPLGAVTELSDGDSTRFQLLLDGKPLADAAVTLRKGGNRYRYKAGEVTLKTDAKGEFIAQWTEPGQYWIGASSGAKGGGEGGTREQPLQRASVSATFEVLPK